MASLILLVLLVSVPLIIIGGLGYKAIEYRKTKYDRALNNITKLERKLDIK